MSLKINGSNINKIKINGSNIQLAKINGEIVFELLNATITLTFADKTIKAVSNKDGNYDFYYSNDDGLITDYDKIVSFSLTANVESSYTYLNSFNIAPYEATKISVCKKGTTNVLSETSLPTQFLFDSSKYGNKLYSFGVLSDVHLDGDGTDEASAYEDFVRAINFYNSNASLIGISGDICINNGYNELSIYKELIDANATIPVYVCKGNHDCRYSSSDWTTYIGKEKQYEITHNNDVFIFLSMNAESFADSMLTTSQLDWLETKLESYKNQRVFLFFHVFMPNTCGNINSLYPYYSMDTTSSKVQRFISLMTKYKNVIYFSGHSHLEFDCQRFGADANIFSDGTTCHRVHIPSCAKPRKNDNGTDSSATYQYYAGSEGYLIDVYENAIVLKGLDFIKGKYLPIANYLLDTTIVNIGDDEEETGNLYDYTTAPILDANVSRSSAIIKTSVYTDKTTYLEIEPSTTYKVTKTAGARFVIGTCANTPVIGTVLNNLVHDYTGTELTTTSTSTDNYLVIYYHSSNDDLTEEEMRKSIVVAKV